MLRPSFVLLATLCLFCVCQCGCLINHANHAVIRHDEPLQALTFESENAKKQFDACADRVVNDDSNVSRAELAIPFLIGLEQSKRISNAGVRNDVAARVDINGDQHISDYEVSLLK